MSYPPDHSRTLVTEHSFGRVLAVSLALALAIPVAVLAASYPPAAVAFAAGLLSGKVSAAALTAIDRAHRVWPAPAREAATLE